MRIVFENLECNLFGRFKVGDNAVYNAELLSNLVAANDDEQFNKPIVIQAASLIEAVSTEIFYRAQRFSREGVPNITPEDQEAIKGKQIDKFCVIIDNLKKYKILDGLDDGIYDELHKLRQYRNKIHIQSTNKVKDVGPDEADQFGTETVDWAIKVNWDVLRFLQDNYPRPASISGYVNPLRLPRLDLSRFDAAPLIAFTATKETYYGTETYGRIPARCSAHRADQWAYTQESG